MERFGPFHIVRPESIISPTIMEVVRQAALKKSLDNFIPEHTKQHML